MFLQNPILLSSKVKMVKICTFVCVNKMQFLRKKFLSAWCTFSYRNLKHLIIFLHIFVALNFNISHQGISIHPCSSPCFTSSCLLRAFLKKFSCVHDWLRLWLPTSCSPVACSLGRAGGIARNCHLRVSRRAAGC